ncbi:MAG: hypothetical protein WDW38_007633 [Sanguina aurantia]
MLRCLIAQQRLESTHALNAIFRCLNTSSSCSKESSTSSGGMFDGGSKPNSTRSSTTKRSRHPASVAPDGDAATGPAWTGSASLKAKLHSIDSKKKASASTTLGTVVQGEAPTREVIMDLIRDHAARFQGPRRGWEVRAASWVKKMPVDRGDVKVGLRTVSGDFRILDELRPRYIVPDLTDFELKPYVGRTKEVGSGRLRTPVALPEVSSSNNSIAQ